MFDVTLPKVAVLGSEMAFRECGRRDMPTVVFLHGNPTSSFIWRRILPIVGDVAHCYAPDLIGFGQSGKPRIEYRFRDHVAYLDAFLAELGVDSAYLVAQDWGTALAFELAARRPAFVRGLAFMEFIRPVESWEEFHQSPQARNAFREFRTPGVGERLLIDGNMFVEKVLPGSVKRTLTQAEMDVYRAPFATPESRVPVWRLPNELPICGSPADVTSVLQDAHAALQVSSYPKLLFSAEPGALVSPAFARAFAASLLDCQVLQLGQGAHYLQEDHPQAIAGGVVDLIRRGEAAASRRPSVATGS